MKQNETFFLVCFVILAALGFAGGLFLRFNENVKLRKRFLPLYHIGLALLFALLFLVAVACGKSLSLLIGIPIIAITTWINLRISFICEKCGKFNYEYSNFAKEVYCAKCGAKVETEHA